MNSEILRKYIDIINEANTGLGLAGKETTHLDEKWETKTQVSPEQRGKYAGKTKEELLADYNALKKKGPYHQGTPQYGKMRELAFAIRAKSNWGKVE